MKICIWGHPLHSHTHSYIHAAFFKAFKALGHETYWLKNGDDASVVNCPDVLFLTETQVDREYAAPQRL